MCGFKMFGMEDQLMSFEIEEQKKLEESFYLQEMEEVDYLINKYKEN